MPGRPHSRIVGNVNNMAPLAGSPRLQRRPNPIEADRPGARRPAVDASGEINVRLALIGTLDPNADRHALLIGRPHHAGRADALGDVGAWQSSVVAPHRLASIADTSFDAILAVEHLDGGPTLELVEHMARIARRGGHVFVSLPEPCSSGDARTLDASKPLHVVRAMQKLGLDVIQLDVLAEQGRGRALLKQGARALRDKSRASAAPDVLLVHATRRC